ncbi:hypothetical protein BDY21DRAFT_342824 [Lineolata rhizophorae]|uniref:Secreted protein n=1 Tax=Lineolata rhizophorae TaxID=578093 RepID=A0A6A6P1Z1_9PEZI|nr:hypothetical protein BDY21DRAFT_342824 [Lineolata rhizophorae]
MPKINLISSLFFCVCNIKRCAHGRRPDCPSICLTRRQPTLVYNGRMQDPGCAIDAYIHTYNICSLTCHRLVGTNIREMHSFAFLGQVTFAAGRKPSLCTRWIYLEQRQVVRTSGYTTPQQQRIPPIIYPTNPRRLLHRRRPDSVAASNHAHAVGRPVANRTTLAHPPRRS